MFKRLIFLLTVTILFLPATSWGKIPPPPVNQNIGMPDISYSATPMTFYTCLGCHGDPANAPAPVKIGYLPDRHHLRVDTPIEEYSDSPYPGESPDGTHKCITCHKVDWMDDPSRPLGGYFKFAKDPAEPEFRNCLNCHKQPVNQYGYLKATVHHLTNKAQKKLCYQCHGAIVNNATDESRIPDPYDDKARNCSVIDPTAIDPDNPIPTDDTNNYDISLITPWPGDNYSELTSVRRILYNFYSECPDVAATYTEKGGKYQINPPRYRYELDSNGNVIDILVPDGIESGRRTGNCEHCHFVGLNPGNAVQPNTGLAMRIGTNMANHHGTGVGQPQSGSVHSCNLCHSPENPPDFTINGCKLCHGISTLHAIEYDAESDGIEPGKEKPFMGHIGNRINCRGCHLNFRSSQFAQNGSRAFARNFDDSEQSMFGDLVGYDIPVPYIESISTAGMVAGTRMPLTITGGGFFTQENGSLPRIELVDTQGTITEIYLNRDDVTETTINTIIPATLKPDTYELYIINGQRYKPGDPGRDYSKYSGAVAFLVTPEVTIDSVECRDDGIVTISGIGFGDMFAVDRYGNEGYVDSQNRTGVKDDYSRCLIKSWTDDQIVAQCSTEISNITLNSIYGEVSSDALCDGGRPDWWSLWSWFASWGWSGR